MGRGRKKLSVEVKIARLEQQIAELRNPVKVEVPVVVAPVVSTIAG